ncbi:MAG: redoxin domain-containing protein [Planctomycetaceae bacterium]|nr:redoxin domain-containing protein [Planctomycetaceae bacterium]
MDRRLWLLGFAGIVILGMVLFAQQRQEYFRSIPPGERPLPRRAAQSFQLYDERKPSQLVKFERYLGRTQIVLVFFDASNGLENNKLMAFALEHANEIQGHGYQLVAVSSATPSAHRASLQNMGIEKSPFPILTDIDVRGPEPLPAHRSYGMLEERPTRTLEGLFLIDRRQTVAMDPVSGQARPVDDPLYVLSELAKGVWPDERAHSEPVTPAE